MNMRNNLGSIHELNESFSAKEEQINQGDIIDNETIIPDLTQQVLARIEELTLQGIDSDPFLDSFNSYLSQYNHELNSIDDSSEEPLREFFELFEENISNVISMTDFEFLVFFNDISQLEGRVSYLRREIYRSSQIIERFTNEFTLHSEDRDSLMREIEVLVSENGMLFVSNEEEISHKIQDVRIIESRLKTLVGFIRDNCADLNTYQYDYFESSYRLNRLLGLDTSNISMEAYLAFGNATPVFMMEEVNSHIAEFEDYYRDLSTGVRNGPSEYLSSLTNSFGDVNDLDSQSIHEESLRAAFETPGGILRLITRHDKREFDAETDSLHFMQAEMHCRFGRELIAQGFTALVHSSETFNDSGESHLHERKNMIFYKKENGNILVHQVTQTRSLSSVRSNPQPTSFRLESALPLNVYEESEIEGLIDFDTRYSTYNLSKLERRPEMVEVNKFISRVVPGLKSLVDASSNEGNKPEDYVDYFKNRASNLRSIINEGKEDFISQKSALENLKSSLENNGALSLSHNLRTQFIKRIDSALEVIQLIESGAIEDILDQICSPDFHSDNLESWLVEDGIILLSALGLSLFVGGWVLGIGYSFLAVVSSASFAGVVGSELGHIISHEVGQFYFGEGYGNLPIGMQDISFEDMGYLYVKDFLMNSFVNFVTFGLGVRLNQKTTAAFVTRLLAISSRNPIIPRVLSVLKKSVSKGISKQYVKNTLKNSIDFDNSGITSEINESNLSLALNIMISTMVFSDPNYASEYFDGHAVGIKSSRQTENSRVVDLFVDHDLNQEFLTEKFPDAQISLLEDGSFEVTYSVGGITNILILRRGLANLRIFEDVPVAKQEAYGLGVDEDGNVFFDNFVPDDEISLSSYLISIGYRVEPIDLSISSSVTNVGVLMVVDNRDYPYEIKRI